jgi:hypothetical protein
MPGLLVRLYMGHPEFIVEIFFFPVSSNPRIFSRLHRDCFVPDLSNLLFGSHYGMDSPVRGTEGTVK